MQMLRSVVLAAAAALVGLARAQLPIPQQPPGFTVGGGSADAGVQLETYIDLVRFKRGSLFLMML